MKTEPERPLVQEAPTATARHRPLRRAAGGSATANPETVRTVLARNAYYVRQVLVATFAVGLFLHGATLVAGRAWLLENILTPAVDVALLVPMAYTTVGLWSLRHRAHHPGRWHRLAYLVLTAYMAVTVVVHLETLWTWEVNYVHRFPHWYSAFIIPIQAAMLLFAARLRFRPPAVPGHGSAGVTTRTLLQAGGAMGVAAGALTVIANVLHPPRTFEGFQRAPLEPSWEPVHALAVLTFIATVFALIGLLGGQVRRGRVTGVVGFALAVTGVVLLIGVLAADAFIFPVLAGHTTTAFLLEVPGPIIPHSSFGILMAVAALTYNLGYILFSVSGWRSAVLPRSGFALMGVGVVPLSVGALAFQGLDIVGAVLVGVGHVILGRALWVRSKAAG